jgi:CheY-like chemotaxis protein
MQPILVVEDNPPIREAIALALASEGWPVATVDNRSSLLTRIWHGARGHRRGWEVGT